MASNTTTTTSLYENRSTTLTINCTASRTINSTLVGFSGSVSVSQQQYNFNATTIRATITDDITGVGVTNYIVVKPANTYQGTATFSFNIDVGTYAGGSRSITARFTVFNSAGTAPVGDTAPLSVSVQYDPTLANPDMPTVSAIADSNSQISITYGTTSFGYPTNGTVKLLGGTEQNPTTEIDSKTTTGDTTFVHTGLVPGVQYYYKAVASNGSLASLSTVVSAMTDRYGMYGSVSGSCKRITKMYGAVNGNTKKVEKIYGSVNGVTKRIF